MANKRVLSEKAAANLEYSKDKRKRRREHRCRARSILRGEVPFRLWDGQTLYDKARWHMMQAKYL
ncbi:hypothetical protein [Methylovulum miyakonense]|uniref:hypothetical protein n=1 Tax=Methylovulum miyakonense TaxID=645578 RepID=UPI00037DE174|nr:hypothetical protein [Methylovulum miyakonense]